VPEDNGEIRRQSKVKGEKRRQDAGATNNGNGLAARELEFGGEGQQGYILGALDGYGEPALMTRAGARHAARQNSAAILNKGREHFGFFVIDQVNLLDAEAANFLFADEITLAALGSSGGPGSALRARTSASGTPAETAGRV
jgi:hypothetical protein